MALKTFDERFLVWATQAAQEWQHRPPDESFVRAAQNRLPSGLRGRLGRGLERGLIVESGHQFTLRGLTAGKGPYSWFSRNRSGSQQPSPNWEYFVQVAEFVQLAELAERHGLTVTFEDDLMDLALYDGSRLVLCCEVKEKATKLSELLRGMRAHASFVDFAVADRGNDALRKSKYLVKRRPEYLSLVAIGESRTFCVSYPSEGAFALEPDVLPFS